MTAPSNTAVDNIIERIIKNGFLDNSGNIYKPNIIRFGGGKSKSVQSVSLEEIVDKEQMTDRIVLNKINLQIKTLIDDIFIIQSYLINLTKAFQDFQILPQGFELRVAVDTGLPYWVDHMNKTSSSIPPSPPVVIIGQQSDLLNMSIMASKNILLQSVHNANTNQTSQQQPININTNTNINTSNNNTSNNNNNNNNNTTNNNIINNTNITTTTNNNNSMYEQYQHLIQTRGISNISTIDNNPEYKRYSQKIISLFILKA